MDNFDLNFTRDAVFRPGSVPVFQHLREEWKTECLSDKSALADWWAANLCQLSYRDEESIKESLNGIGSFIDSYRAKTQMAFVCEINRQVFLVIQGSCTPEDNIIDVKFLKKKFGDAAFHRGFLEATDSLWPQLKNVIADYEGDLILCGHSLGGAIAQIIASRVEVSRLVTFGAPRVAGCEILGLIASPYTRYVNCCDAVPMLPPKLLGFSHTGELVFIDDLQQLITNESLWIKLRTSVGYFISLNWCKRKMALTRSLTDHSPVNYCQALARHLIEKELEK